LLKYADQEPDMGVTTQVLLFGQAKEDHWLFPRYVMAFLNLKRFFVYV
jgi:hypothetical protein